MKFNPSSKRPRIQNFQQAFPNSKALRIKSNPNVWDTKKMKTNKTKTAFLSPSQAIDGKKIRIQTSGSFSQHPNDLLQ